MLLPGHLMGGKQSLWNSGHFQRPCPQRPSQADGAPWKEGYAGKSLTTGECSAGKRWHGLDTFCTQRMKGRVNQKPQWESCPEHVTPRKSLSSLKKTRQKRMVKACKGDNLPWNLMQRSRILNSGSEAISFPIFFSGALFKPIGVLEDLPLL